MGLLYALGAAGAVPPPAGAGAPGPPGMPAGLAAASVAAFMEWPLKVRVGENSPSLWPTMFSVMYTGMNFLPLCTARVWPMNSGTMVDRRDHVRTTFFSFFSLRSATFFIKWSSTNGPLCSERPITVPPLPFLGLPRDDPFVGPLVVAGLEPPRRLPPRRHRMPSAAGFALAASVRMIYRVHRHAPVVRPFPHPALAARFAKTDVFVLDIAHLADRGRALDRHAPDLARRKLQKRDIAFL